MCVSVRIIYCIYMIDANKPGYRYCFLILYAPNLPVSLHLPCSWTVPSAVKFNLVNSNLPRYAICLLLYLHMYMYTIIFVLFLHVKAHSWESFTVCGTECFSILPLTTANMIWYLSILSQNLFIFPPFLSAKIQFT